MNRRNFLRYVAYAAPLAIAAPAVARTIFLPTWPPPRLAMSQYLTSPHAWFLKEADRIRMNIDRITGVPEALLGNQHFKMAPHGFGLAPVKAEGTMIAYGRCGMDDLFYAVDHVGRRYRIVEELPVEDLGRRIHEAYLESQRHTKLNVMARILNQGVK